MMRITCLLSACLVAGLPAAAAFAAEPGAIRLAQAGAPTARPPLPASPQATPPKDEKPPLLGSPAPSSDRSVANMEAVRKDRKQGEEAGRIVIREPGRLIVREGDRLAIRHDDTFRTRPGAREAKVDRQGDETTTTVIRQDGTRVISVVDKDERLLRRTRIDRHGKEVVILDSKRASAGGNTGQKPPGRDVEPVIVEAGSAEQPAIEEVLAAAPLATVERPYALEDIRDSVSLRDRMPRLDIDTLSFAADSWELAPGEVGKLQGVAEAMIKAIRGNPGEFFLIEGHTDVEGSEIDNLSLSDRRAESVAMTLTRGFGVPPENLATQGYGEQFPKVKSDEPVNENRRITIRRITPLLAGTTQAGR
jgi:OmpA-OmpF porin, OOP family